MTEVGVHEAKTHLSRLLRRVAAGEEIAIDQRRTPAARLVPIDAPRAERSASMRTSSSSRTTSTIRSRTRDRRVRAVTYLLDTHVWLWMLADPARIRAELLAELTSSRTRLLLSAASSWEIAIKWAMGRLPLPEPPDAFVPSRMQRTGVTGLAVEHVHALHVATLPAHHRDPSTDSSSPRPRVETARHRHRGPGLRRVRRSRHARGLSRPERLV